nr:hypothetical protein CFP56_07698 [Quercus suber]
MTRKQSRFQDHITEKSFVGRGARSNSDPYDQATELRLIGPLNSVKILVLSTLFAKRFVSVMPVKHISTLTLIQDDAPHHNAGILLLLSGIAVDRFLIDVLITVKCCIGDLPAVAGPQSNNKINDCEIIAKFRISVRR